MGNRVEILRDFAESGHRNCVAREHVPDPTSAGKLAKRVWIINCAANHIPAHRILLTCRGPQQSAEVAIVELGKRSSFVRCGEAARPFAVSLVACIEEAFVLSVVDLRNRDRAAEAESIVLLTIERARHTSRIVDE